MLVRLKPSIYGKLRKAIGRSKFDYFADHDLVVLGEKQVRTVTGNLVVVYSVARPSNLSRTFSFNRKCFDIVGATNREMSSILYREEESP